MRKVFVVVLLAGFILMVPRFAAGGNGTISNFRCEQYLISVGMAKSEVRTKCGEPTNVETWEEERIKQDFYKNIPVQSQEELYQEPLLVN